MPGLLGLLSLLMSVQAATEPGGAQLYNQHCATCHDHATGRIPSVTALKKMPVNSIEKSLQTGAMRSQGAAMTKAEQRTLAVWLGTTLPVVMPGAKVANPCVGNAPALTASAPAWNGWGAGLENRRSQTAAAAGLTVGDLPRLKLKWAYGFEGGTAMRSQPAVYGGRIFAGGPDSTLVSLNAVSGCVYWSAELATPVRTGITIGVVNGAALLYFGDGAAQVSALDAITGQPVWRNRVEDHPAANLTGTPVFYSGRLYVPVSSFEEASAMRSDYACCSFRGSLLALDAASGKALWKTYTIAESARAIKGNKLGPSGAGIWSSPTLDPEHGMIYVTTGDNYSEPATKTSDAVMALAMATGRVVWSRQFTEGDVYNMACDRPGNAACPEKPGPDSDFGSSPILVGLAGGKRVLLLPQKSGVLHAVDPDKEGTLLWHARVGAGGVLGGIQWGAASDGTKVYVALSDVSFVAAGQSFMPDPKKGGGMFAFRVDNGERLWSTAPPACVNRVPCSPAQSQAVSAIPGAVFSGSMDGHLRAFSTTDGQILWDYDAVHDVTTVNNVGSKGGAFDAGGAVIAGGMVYVGSGYGLWNGLAGNVLLAFSVDGK